MELVRRGCVYFSDEYALIDSQGLVHPYPRALQVRQQFHELWVVGWLAGVQPAWAAQNLAQQTPNVDGPAVLLF